MPSYLVTGASRGLGLEYIRQLSINSENQVFALVRNKETSTNLNDFHDNKNVHVVQADIIDHATLKAAAAEVSEITDGKLDVLINNAALIETGRFSLPLTAFNGQEDVLEKDLRSSFEVNVIGVIHTINAFLPLLQRGAMKKVITISTGIADPQFLEKIGMFVASPYAISKAATNMVVTKYAIQFKGDGITFLALSPGFVNTLGRKPTIEELERHDEIVAMFRRAKPTFERALTPEESVKAQLQVIDNISLEDSGAFVSLHGNKDWL